MKYATLLVATWLAAGPALADLLLPNGLTTNFHFGQPTAHYRTASYTYFDVFVDIEDVNNNTLCISTDPCFDPTIGFPQPDVLSRPFNSGYFKMSFQALMNGSPITVTGAGLNQRQQTSLNLLDVYFDVDLGNGISQEGALGIEFVHNGTSVTPFVTGPGAIGWGTAPNPFTHIMQSTFELDPMAFEDFEILLLSGLTLSLDPPPPLTPNPNLVPEPSSVLLLATVAIVASRRRPRTAVSA